jgi:hypothetical protein
MTSYEKEEVNKLLGMLRSFDVIRLITEYFYGKYENNAPQELLKEQIEKVQKLLENQ